MGRHIPTDWERDAIDRLTLAGHKVVRQSTYDNLLKRIDRAENNARWEAHLAEANREWARDAHTEQRRLSRRLDEVCTAAAALGVSIHDINAALDAADKKG